MRNETGLALVATSGDTGSAALAGFARCDRVRCVVLFPEGRVSTFQRKQMTTMASSTASVFAVNGTFDDCQKVLKRVLSNPDLRQKQNIIAVNSINFARIVCQIVYYFWAVLRIQAHNHKFDQPVHICVPTGNFGNILAGWYAKRMGCPISQLIIASNSNDILPRFLHTGIYAPVKNVDDEVSKDTMQKIVSPCISPAIDIQISSNLERLLYHISGSTETEVLYGESTPEAGQQ